MNKNSLHLIITQGEDRTLNLCAETMNELVDKIIDWQKWNNQSLDYFKKKGNDRLKEEKESGWYYFE